MQNKQEVEPVQHGVETLPGGTRVWVNETHKIGTDSLLLARFCQPWQKFSVCDIGSGCGVILLSLWDSGLRGTSLGIEQDADGAALLAGAANDNGFTAIQSLHTDLRAYKSTTLFDMAVANPPYFTSGQQAENPARALARHQINGSLQDFCNCALRILKDGGRFCVCYPTTGLAHLFACLQAAKLQPKRIQLARKSATAAPWLALVDARKNGGVGLTFLPDIVLPPGSAVHY